MNFYNRKGEKIHGLHNYIEESKKDRSVKKEVLENGLFVSTVFLVLDHNHWGGGNGKPLIFETMVFSAKKSDTFLGPVPSSLDMDRYSTEEEALAGHDAMVNKWSS